MKAIVNVNANSAYANFNGYTFEVKEVLSKIVALNINGNTVDFSHNEVLIVDFTKELQAAYDDANWNSSRMAMLHNLRAYKIANKIADVVLTYNCPA